MEYAIMGVTFGLCLFILPLWAYRRGMKDMKALMEGKTPEPIQNPVQAVTQHYERKVEAKEAKAANDSIAEGLANIMSYTGEPQKPKEVS